MRFGGFSFGSIRIDGLRYGHDVVIDRAADVVYIVKRGAGMSDGRAKKARSAASRKSERIERTGSTAITWLSGSRSGLTLKVLRRLNCCRRKRLRGLAEATRIDLAKATVTISPERGDGTSGGLQLRPFFPIRLLEDRPSLKRNVEHQLPVPLGDRNRSVAMLAFHRGWT